MIVSTHYKFRQQCLMASTFLAAFLTLSFVIYVAPSTTSSTSSSDAGRSMPTMYFPEECDYTMISGFTEGLIVSQRTYRYRPNLACTMNIAVRNVLPLRLTFDYLDLPEASSGGCDDYIQLYVGDVNAGWTALGQQICGRTLPDDIVSHVSNISIVFKTNGLVEGTGFRFRFMRNQQASEVCAPGRGCVRENNVIRVPSSHGSSFTTTNDRGVIRFVVLSLVIVLILALLRLSHIGQKRCT